MLTLRESQTMRYLFIFNDSPHGSQRTYNGLRLVSSISKSRDNEVSVFLVGDGVITALGGPNPLNAFYNTQELLKQILKNDVQIGVCRTCMEARGIGDGMLLEGVKRSTLDELTTWTEEAEKVITF